MKKTLIFVGMLLLSGCNTIGSVNGDDYLTATPSKPNSSMIGFWVGASGPYLNTLKINDDGTGEFCYSWNNKNAHGKLIFDGTNIIYQSGEKLEVTKLNSNIIETRANYYMTENYKFYKDDNLYKSSSYCKNVFSQ